MHRTHNCGELRMEQVGLSVTLCGWVNSVRNFGGMTFIDLRDRYGISQLVFNTEIDAKLYTQAEALGREYVIQVDGTVTERSNKNKNRPTGDIEILVSRLTILNLSKIPPFTIENDTDGGEEIRMKYRFLDLRRAPVQKNIIFRSRAAIETRKYLASIDFLEIETPFLIKSTPEGARDFVVPSRLNPGKFYALPQSPQTFKQLLMVAGFDKYFQITKCFRDEDLRADRQPEFTQIDCEMSFVEQDDILNTFEGLTRHLFSQLIGVNLSTFPIMPYDTAMNKYGIDKPDLRFEMPLIDLNEQFANSGFSIFDNAEHIGGLCLKGLAGELSNKWFKEMTTWVQSPQIGASGLIYIKHLSDGSIKSSIGKFFSDEALKQVCSYGGVEQGDVLLILCGVAERTRSQLGLLRLELADRFDLIPTGVFKPLWVVDFPLLEWDEDSQRYHAMHHPFTSPKKSDMDLIRSKVHSKILGIRADAYDLVINGVEIGGGSIRIHDRQLQEQAFSLLGFTPEEAQAQFGFLMGAFEYGAPPHGGIAFGFDRLCAVMNGQKSIRDFIPFPKNNKGVDLMIDAPADIDAEQLAELQLDLTSSQKKANKSNQT